MIKAVVFDLDGTLLDRDSSLKRFIADQFVRLNRFLGHISEKQYIERFIELDAHGYVWKDKVYQQLAEEFKIEGISAEGLLQDYVNEFQNHCIPFQGLKDLLEKLKKRSIRLGMITNGKGQFQMNNIVALGIEDYFDCILISELEGLKKPDPEIFQRALERMGLAANDCLFVGDHPDNDVEAAIKAGMHGVWKKNGQWKSTEADFQIDKLEELLDIISKQN